MARQARKKKRGWQKPRTKGDQAFPKLFRQLGLIPEDTEFNRRAKAYAYTAKTFADTAKKRRRTLAAKNRNSGTGCL